MWRTAILLLVLGLGSCAGDDMPPAENYAPLHYDYLRQLRLNIASIDVQDASPPPGPGDVTQQDPVQPGQVLAQIARDRLFAAGTVGRAVFTVDSAAITQDGDGRLTGQFAVHLDILTDAGVRAAYAAASVTRQHMPGSDPENLRNNLYDMTRQIMDAMNVELEFQMRRSMRDWLVSTTAVPAPVTATPLETAAPAPPASLPALLPASPPRAPSFPVSPPEQVAPPDPAMPGLDEPPQQMSPPPSFLQPR